MRRFSSFISRSTRTSFLWSRLLTLSHAVTNALNFDGRVPRILAIIITSDISSLTSFSWRAMFSILATCYAIKSAVDILYSWNLVISKSLLDALFCSCMVLSFDYISTAVSQVIKYLRCEYSMEDDIMHIAFAFFVHHAVYVLAVGSGFAILPSAISMRPLATKTARSWNFHNWKFEPLNFVMLFKSILSDILSIFLLQHKNSKSESNEMIVFLLFQYGGMPPQLLQDETYSCPLAIYFSTASPGPIT